MNDPHVERLYYEIIYADSVDYCEASDIVEETERFRMSVSHGSIVFDMREHYSAVEAARVVVDEYLRAWALLIGLSKGPKEMTFSFKTAEVVDRAPARIENGVVIPLQTLQARFVVSDVASVRATRGAYPPRPTKFLLSVDLEAMYGRYKAYHEGREQLASMAYMCYTVLKVSAGGHEEAASQYKISSKVLRKLTELSSTRGDALEVRKMPSSGTLQPLTGTERIWLEEVVKTLIRRVGEWAYDPEADLPQLTMADFPALT